jgi:hypothetical protein
MFYKFSKGKAIYSVPNGLGDGSAYFDGNSSNARIESGLNVLPSGSTSGSISVWFYQKSGTGLRGIVGYGVFGATSQDRFIMTNFPYIYSCGYNDDYTYNSKSIEYNKWYHVTMVYENGIEKCYLNGELIGQREFSFSTTVSKIDIGWHDNSRYFHGNIKDILFYNRALTQDEVTALYNKGTVADGLVLSIPLQYEKDDESIFSSKNFVYDYATLTTSSGFNAIGKPIRYRSASEAGIEYSPIDIPKDGLVFYADYKNGKDRVTKTQGECSNVDFIKYKGCNCAYFNGVDSSILWKNILTSDLQHYTIFTKFSALPKEHWGMIFGISPENQRTQGYSMKTHGEYLSYTNRGSDKGGAGITYDTFCVGTLVGYGEWIEIYLNGTVYLGHAASSIPANSWLYNGIDFGYTNVDPQPYYGYIAESIVYNRTFSKDELQALTQQLLNKGA